VDSTRFDTGFSLLFVEENCRVVYSKRVRHIILIGITGWENVSMKKPPEPSETSEKVITLIK
jgi:hypothetical protein